VRFKIAENVFKEYSDIIIDGILPTIIRNSQPYLCLKTSRQFSKQLLISFFYCFFFKLGLVFRLPAADSSGCSADHVAKKLTTEVRYG